METRAPHLRAALHLFRRRQRASRSPRRREEKVGQRLRPQEVQRRGDFLRQSAGEICPRANGAVNDVATRRRNDEARMTNVEIIEGIANRRLLFSSSFVI